MRCTSVLNRSHTVSNCVLIDLHSILAVILIYHSYKYTWNYWDFGLCPSSGILKIQRTECFGNWICFLLQVGGDTYSVGSHRKSWPLSLDQVSFFYRTQQSTSLPSTSPEDGNRNSFRKVVFCSFLEYRKIDKVQKLSDSVCYAGSSEPFRIFDLDHSGPSH
jgi:hypothetical protein